MNYKYRKGQIFGKKLNVPSNILVKVYNCTLSFSEFIEYELADKIPITCLKEVDRQIVEKFGIEKTKNLDWELLNKSVYYHKINFKELLMGMNPSEEDLNRNLYELVKDQIKPSDYTSGMKAIYQDRLFEISNGNDDDFYYEKLKFNNGETSLKDFIRNYDLYERKDFSYCLQQDSHNKQNITNHQLKDFMNKFGNISRLILDETDIYQFIHEMNDSKSELEQQTYIKQFTDNILEKTMKKGGNQQVTKLSESEYKELFKYSSMQDYLKRVNQYWEDDIDQIFEELKTLPPNYIWDIPIPFDVLNNPNVLRFIGSYGLKNVVDFDNECGHFFTKDNCHMLKLMDDMYLHYAGNVHDPNKNIYTRNPYDENGNYVDGPHTKDEFYEAMRRMIIYGPTDWNYVNKAPDYRDMTGEFRRRNAQLFISEQAPEELQKLFYTKSITPQLLVKHPEYIPYLNGKNLSSCFKPIEVKVEGIGYENMYNFLSSKTDFYGVMNFITEYSGVLDRIIEASAKYMLKYELKFSTEDNMNQLQKKINEAFRRIVIEKKEITFPRNIPEQLRENYPTMFLSSDAPEELQEAFYNRTINSEFISSNPGYHNYLKSVDLEILYKYMPVSVIGENNRHFEINLVNAIQQLFGTEARFDIMLMYGNYIESIFEINRLQNFKLNSSFSKDDLLNEIDSNVLQAIIDGKIKYDETISSHFQNNNPTLFLNKLC